MCGIAGVYHFEGRADDADLARMNECQYHRGPDESGTYSAGSVGIAHRRLSIIDLDGGRQPIFNEDESVAVVFNGEIYNYAELRESLQARGHSFHSETDTEVLVHMYEEHGPAFVKRLEGMFAFALWDESGDQLVLARDRFGIKPLCYFASRERVVFASEIPSILAADVDHGGIDREAVGLYFVFEFIPAPLTVFDGIQKLLPGEYAVISEAGLRRERYYTPSVASSDASLEASAASLRTRVEDAVEKRLMSDVPIGAFLSGGIDSSIVTATMSELTNESIPTFTVGFDDEMFDESWAAREVAEYHGTDHHEYTVDPDDVVDLVPEVLGRLGEPFGDASLLPTYVVSRESSADVKVALSGDGADELFAGYDRYRAEYLSRYYASLPPVVRENVISPAIESLPARRSGRLSELAWKAQFFTRAYSADDVERHLGWLRVVDDRVRDIVTASTDPAATAEADLRDQHDYVREFLPADRQDALSRMQAVDVGYKLPHQILTKVDRASMYNSLEVRVPLLDANIVESAMSYPTRQKITLRTQKLVLKRAFEDRLPESILRRGKQGFEMPVGQWLKEDLADDFVRTVRSLDGEIVRPEGILETYREHVSGRRNHERFLWSAYVFGKWKRRMESNGVL